MKSTSVDQDRFSCRNRRCELEHQPKVPLCPVHGTRWQPFHNKEITALWGIQTIFYCRHTGCGDQFDWDKKYPEPWVSKGTVGYALGLTRTINWIVERLFKAELRIAVVNQRALSGDH